MANDTIETVLEKIWVELKLDGSPEGDSEDPPDLIGPQLPSTASAEKKPSSANAGESGSKPVVPLVPLKHLRIRKLDKSQTVPKEPVVGDGKKTYEDAGLKA